MRLSHVVRAVAAMTVVGTCSVWAADPPKTVDLSRVLEPRPTVGARQALRTTVNELNVEAVPVARVIEYLRDVSGANIVVNWKVLEAAGVGRDAPVTLQVRELSLRKMLTLVLDQVSPAAPLTFSTDSNVLEITSQEEADKHMITKVYIVDDLVMTDNATVTPPSFNLTDITKSGNTAGSGGGGGGGGGSLFTETNTTTSGTGDSTEKRGENLVTLVKEVIRPAIWRDAGGVASIRYFSGKLIVTAPISVHEAIGGPVAPEGGQRFGM